MPPSPSPATWHVLFWILTSLAISSMAQPSGKFCGQPSRYRVYLASSPIMCVADAVSMTVRLNAVMCGLCIGPKKASQLVMLARSEQVSNGLQTAKKQSAVSQSHTWPRILFFIMGTLPAAIKVVSLLGIPWTKTWGMMFVASFMEIELITLLAHTGDTADDMSVATILDLDAIEKEQGIQQGQVLRAKLARLSRRIDALEAVLFCLAFLSHAGLIAWTVEMLWTPALEAMKTSKYAQTILTWTKASLYLLTILLLLMMATWHLLRRCTSLPKGAFGRRTLVWLFKADFTSFFLPQEQRIYSESNPSPTIPPVPAWLTNIQEHIVIWFYLWAFFYALYWALRSICGRWPIIAKALLLKPDDKEASEVDGQQRNSDKVLEAGDGPIEEAGWASFMFFLTNLGVCLLWYAFMYDPTDTVNPSWTDVFG